MTEPEPLPDLGRYLVERDRQRADRVQRFLGTLTGSELDRVTEAATIGHRLGTQYPAGTRVPPDSVVFDAVSAQSSWAGTRLSPRELWLLREVAVMAHVRGAMNRVDLDADQAVAAVVAHCQSMPDRYPIVAQDLERLVLKIVRLYDGAHVEPVVGTVVILAARPEAEAAAAVQELIADERITRTSDGFLKLVTV